MESQIKILLVDANETFTAQLSSVLGQNPAFDVVGAANDGECAVELLHREQPDVLIMDLLLPKLDGAAGSGADGLSDRLRRAGGRKARRAVLYQQAV